MRKRGRQAEIRSIFIGKECSLSETELSIDIEIVDTCGLTVSRISVFLRPRSGIIFCIELQ